MGQPVLKEIITNLENINIKVTEDKKRETEAKKQIQILHSKDDGYITVAVKKDKLWSQYHYKYNVLKEHIGKVLGIEGVNIYMSPNSFYVPFRRIENVRKLNSLYIDLDYYTINKFKNKSVDDILYILEKDYFDKKVPKASFIVITGRGLCIYWSIEPVPKQALPLWNAVQKIFLDKLKNIGADQKSIDAARVMRLAGSINQKNEKVTEILVYDEKKYVLKDIQEKYVPKLTPYVKNPCHRQRGRKANVVKMFTLYSLHLARLKDIVKIQELRGGMCRNSKGQLLETGQREFMCFLYRYWCCCFTSDVKKALEDTKEFNKNFKRPLRDKEVEKQTASAQKAYEKWLENEFHKKKKSKDEVNKSKDEVNKSKDEVKEKKNGTYEFSGYNYKNDTLIDLLNITDIEMKDLETIIGKDEVKRRTNVRTNEYNKVKFKAERRNKAGLTKREQAKLDKIKDIKELRETGLTQKQIARKINITQQAVSKLLKEM
ncbi:DNA-binding response regulator (plasmid) [Haloimpatiens sp. FM7330]|uniref:DNA-binding response regulator n=1 Tax=Haloimpatiens sp. FM7330 TaxID=3298610 RepID=UPI00362904BE